MEELIEIQNRLKAPKSQFNDFGKYKYRNCEDILEAVKPLLKETGTTLIISDDLVLIGDRYYVKATVTLQIKDASVSVTAFAREALDKKGMDASQVTGAASSYARKYALNGLFAIDDNKDAGSEEVEYITEKQLSQIVDMANESGTDAGKFLKYMGVDSLEAIPADRFKMAMSALGDKLKAKQAKDKADAGDN